MAEFWAVFPGYNPFSVFCVLSHEDLERLLKNICVYVCAHMCTCFATFASSQNELQRNSNATALLRACLPPPGFKADS